jgi:hypothetical protein
MNHRVSDGGAERGDDVEPSTFSAARQTAFNAQRAAW